ncbi:MAG: molybdopterin-dependent oxidoreductase [Thermodesulfobacteriota bacterium]|nr:molybdopterin-dependent oxidoreductase [Thermodesulfobacteriota bacterium]
MKEYEIIGRPLPRVDGIEKATGQGKFTVDMVLPAMLHGKFLRSPYPHAKILSINVEKAKKLPGVKAVITRDEVAGIRYAFVDTPRYPADETPLAVDKVRYIGDEVAAVAAIDLDTAEEAIHLIEVEYKPLTPVFDSEEAMKPGAPDIHEPFEPESTSEWEDWGVHRDRRALDWRDVKNLSGRTSVAFGDVERGFAQSDYVREDRFETKATAHCALEPHAALAFFDLSGKLSMYLSSMGIFYKRFILAKALGLSISQVRILKSYVGGAFGGKIDLFPYEFCAAFLARLTGKPVRFELDREEVFTCTRQRHPTIIDVKTGVKKDGTIMSQQIKFIADNGAYRGSGAIVIYLGHAFSIPVYSTPNYRYEGYAVYTNNPIRGPQRAHGSPQIRFAIDSQITMIAEDLGLDPLKIMLKNARKEGDVLPNGDLLRSCGLTECLEKAAQTSNWRGWRGDREKRLSEHRSSSRYKKGMGISACSMFCGAPFYPFASAAIVKLHDDGSATLYTGVTEMGQGSDTTMAQIVAEELGLGLEDIKVVSGDTELCPIDLGQFLSGGAFVTGNAVRLAALDAKSQLMKMAMEMLGAEELAITTAGKKVYVKGSPEKNISCNDLIQLSIQRNNGNPIIGKGNIKAVQAADFYPSLAKAKGHFTDAYGFAVQVAEVEVDTLTGRIKVLRTVTFHDCGFPLNRSIVEGQVHGNVSMGMGQALWEEILLENGQIQNPSFLNYRAPLATETPLMISGLVESRDPGGPYGAKEVGEGSISGMLGAIANAIDDAIGIRFTSLPITPEKVLEALGKR